MGERELINCMMCTVSDWNPFWLLVFVFDVAVWNDGWLDGESQNDTYSTTKAVTLCPVLNQCELVVMYWCSALTDAAKCSIGRRTPAHTNSHT